MLTCPLFKTQCMLLSATSRKGQPDADLLPVQNQDHGLVSIKQEGADKCRLTSYSKPKPCSCQQQAGRASQMLTCPLFKTQSMLTSATSRKGQPDADLQSVQNKSMLLSTTSSKSKSDTDLLSVQSPEHPVRNKQEGPAR